MSPLTEMQYSSFRQLSTELMKEEWIELHDVGAEGLRILNVRSAVIFRRLGAFSGTLA